MRSVIATAMVLALALTARADERLKGIACRSVHLQFPGPAGTAFYNEVKVDRSAPGTYFCVAGFNHGYFGLQELASGKKLVIFSVWDPASGDDPKKVPEEKRVKLLYQGEGVRVGRFGNEGTGGQSFFDFDWKIGETYRFLVASKPVGDRTEFTAYFWLPESKSWKTLVSFSTITGGKPLGGYYSFVEDFKRDRISPTKTREAHFGNGWVLTQNGKWEALLKARFTADSNPVTNIQARKDGERFVLATGGEIEMGPVKLKDTMDRPAAGAEAPTDLPKLAKP